MNNPWNDIEIPSHEFNVRLVSNKHPLSLYWGKDARGGYLFVAQFLPEAAPDKKVLPELVGIRVAVAKTPDCARLVLLLNETANWEIFKALCIDLIHASETASDDIEAVSIIVRRLVRWHEFMKRERINLLSPEAIKGLIGELLFLEEKLVPRFGWDTSISFWKGPTGAPQDFAVHDTAVEVKCQSGVSTPYIQISSLEQLEAQLPNFYLVVYTLATTEQDNQEGFSLNSLIERICIAMSKTDDMTREFFESLIFQAGYMQLDNYNEPRFCCVAVRTFHVTDNFPRLTVATVPEGISKASYHISLDACVPYEQKLKFDREDSNDN